MKRKNVIILVLAVLLLISLLTACGSNVSFKIDFIVDGAVIHTIDTKGNEEIQLPADPEKEGYIFDGWYWDKDSWEKPFTANSLLDAPLSSDMSVYARWITEAEYTITFESNGGNGITAINEHGGKAISAPANPTRAGYTFSGWYTDAECQNSFTFLFMPESNITLYAKWSTNTTNEIYITFQVDGAEYVKVKTSGNEMVSIPNNPSKSGYNFSGWYWADGKAFTVNSLLTTPISASMTVYAKWTTEATYTLTFVTNGGGTVSSISFHGGEAVTQPTPTRNGYIFGGWYIDNGTFSNKLEFDEMPASNLTVYAKWTANNADPYISINGGTVNGTDLYIDVEYTATQVDLSAIITVASGASWELYKDITGQTKIATKYASSLKNGYNTYYVVITTNQGEVNRTYTLYIYRNYYVTMTYISEDVTYATEQVLTHTTMGEGPDISRTGYAFNEWGCNGYYVTEAKTFTANWIANIYDVTLDVNGGEQLSATEYKLTFDASFSLPVPQRTGYTFVGWYTSATSGTQYASGTGASTKVWSIAVNTTLHAQWSINSYTVTLNTSGSGGSVSGGGSKTYNSIVTITASTYLGYTWLGWYDGNTKISEGTSLSYTFTLSTENRSFTAKWEANKCNIVLDANGGSEVIETEYIVEYNSEYSLPIPTLNDFTFAGWYGADGDITQKFTDYLGKGIAWSNAESMILYAHWVRSDEAIYNLSQLQNIQLNKNYYLISDIDCNGAALNPIGNSENPYTGVFDGCGYTISNYTINFGEDYGSSRNGGLFGNNSGTIRNLKLGNLNMDISVQIKYYGTFGALVGINNGTIMNCCITNSNLNIGIYGIGNCHGAMGGLIGFNYGNLISSYSSANIKFTSLVYGVAYSRPNSTYQYAAHTTACAGGLVGCNGGEILYCYSSGEVSVNSTIKYTASSSLYVHSSYARAGGLVGNNSDYYTNNGYTNLSEGKISNSFSTSIVQATGESGSYYAQILGGYSGTGEVINSYKTESKGADGEVATITNLKNGIFLKESVKFNEYNDKLILTDYPYNVWIFNVNEYPILYWE